MCMCYRFIWLVSPGEWKVTAAGCQSYTRHQRASLSFCVSCSLRILPVISKGNPGNLSTWLDTVFLPQLQWIIELLTSRCTRDFQDYLCTQIPGSFMFLFDKRKIVISKRNRKTWTCQNLRGFLMIPCLIMALALITCNTPNSSTGSFPVARWHLPTVHEYADTAVQGTLLHTTECCFCGTLIANSSPQETSRCLGKRPGL